MPKLTLLEEESKSCSSCMEDKLLSEFYYREDRGGYVSKCKSCISDSYAARYIKDPSVRAAKSRYAKGYYNKNKERLYANAKKRRGKVLKSKICSLLSNSRHNKKWDYDLSLEFAMELYDKQEGKCALSGESLELTGDRYLSNMISIDRIDSSRGYLEDNVQFVCVKYNMMKAHASMEDFVEMCNRIVEYNSCPV